MYLWIYDTLHNRKSSDQFPLENGDFQGRTVNLPEGNCQQRGNNLVTGPHPSIPSADTIANWNHSYIKNSSN